MTRLIAFALFFVCAANFTLNNFYVTGASVWDAGWFAWLASQALTWPMPNPTVLGGYFLAIHASPVFFLLSAVKMMLPAMPDPVWFALTQGLWFGLLGLAAALCAGAGWRGLILALLTAANGITLATVGFPHIEIAIPALLLLAVALRGHAWAWLPPLLLMLTVREDAGFHAALAFAALALLRGLSREEARPDAAIAAACLLAGCVSLVVQHGIPGGGAALSSTYLGRPPLVHLDAAFVADRVHYLVKDRSYVWGPLLLLTLAAAWTRDMRLAAGVLISLPWLALSFVAVSHQAGEMWDYYSFPLMAGLCWPLICARRVPRVPRRFLTIQAAMAVLSIGLFIGSGGNHDRRPWTSFGFAWWGRIAPVEAALDDLAARMPPHLVVDDATAALRLGLFSSDQLHANFEFTAAEQGAVRILIYRPGSWVDGRKQAMIRRLGLGSPEILAGGFLVKLTRRGPPP